MFKKNLKKIINILIIFLLLFMFSRSLSASEIFGRISTNMNYQENIDDPDQDDSPGEDVDDSTDTLLNNSSGGSLIFTFNNQGEEQGEIKVLGVSQYVDGTLVRGSDQKIYVIYGDFKDYICSFIKLQRYAGQIIYSISDEDLERYKTRNYVHGDLIREKEDEKVFVIVSGKLKHILSLEELRINFKGQEIFNVSGDEMGLYY